MTRRRDRVRSQDPIVANPLAGIPTPAELAAAVDPATGQVQLATDQWPDLTGGEEPENIPAEDPARDLPLLTIYQTGLGNCNTGARRLARAVCTARGVHDQAHEQWAASGLKQAGLAYLRPTDPADPDQVGAYWARDGSRVAFNCRRVLEYMETNILPDTCLEVPLAVSRAGSKGICLTLLFRNARLRKVQRQEETALPEGPGPGEA